MSALSAPLPLRVSTVWGGFREALPIPWRWGRTAGALIQYDGTRTLWCWADHAVEGIDAVQLNGVETGGWNFRNAVDPTGHAVALVELSQAAPEGAALSASGRGRLHPRTGQRMTSPATILWDLLAHLAGRDITESDVGNFDADCRRLGLEAAGSISTPDSAQTVARALCESVGAVFCEDSAGLARVWPGGSLPASVETIGARQSIDSAAASLDDIVTVLTLRFDPGADDQPRQTVELTAPDALARHGRRTREMDMRWLVSARVAAQVGTRLMQQAARAQYVISASKLSRAAVGDAVTLDTPALPLDGAHMVLAREWVPQTGSVGVTFRVSVGAVPRVTLSAQTSASMPQAYAGVAVTTVGTDRILTLTEADGAPITNAQVTLDGSITHYTDNAGRVSFPASAMPAGEHTLDILTADGRTLSQTVLVT